MSNTPIPDGSQGPLLSDNQKPPSNRNNRAWGNGDTPIPLPALLAILLILLILGSAGVAAFAWTVQKGYAGETNNLYYFLLIVWGLISAIILVGLLRSSGKVTGQHLGLRVELTGAGAVFAVVVLGGLFLVKPENVPFSVWVTANDGTPVNAGKLTMYHDNSSSASESISDGGQVKFGSVSKELLGHLDELTFSATVPGFSSSQKSIQQNVRTHRYEFVLDPQLTDVSGKVRGTPHFGNDAYILIEGQTVRIPIGDDGAFKAKVQGVTGGKWMMEICVDGKQRFHDPDTLQSYLEISIRSATGPCQPL